MKILSHRFRRLKMKSQIFIIDSFIMALVIFLILGVYFVQSTILLTLISNASEKIMMGQEKIWLELTSIKIKNYLDRKYQLTISNLIHVDLFFQYILTKQNNFYNIAEDLFPYCLEQDDPMFQIQSNSNLFCFQSLSNEDGITLPQNDSQIDYFRLATSILSQYSFLFAGTLIYGPQLSVTDLPNTYLLASYPQKNQIQNFHIQDRPWFTFYMNASQSDPNNPYYYTPVYQSQLTFDFIRTIISTIFDLNGNVRGFSRNNLQLTDPYIASLPLNTILTNNNGEVLLNSLSSIQSKESLFLQNSYQTGFNYSDWQLIQQFLNTNSSPQLCYDQADTFCLFNKIFNLSVQVNVLEFKAEDYYLIVFSNIIAEIELKQQLNQMTASLHDDIKQKIIIQVFISLVLIVLTAILIHRIFNPLFQLLNNLKLHIQALGNNLNQEIFKMMNRRRKPTNVIHSLNLRFMTLKDQLNKSQTQKSKLCQQIESIQYNSKPLDIDYFSISSKLDQVYNDHYKKRGNIFILREPKSKGNMNTLDLINYALRNQYRNSIQQSN